MPEPTDTLSPEVAFALALSAFQGEVPPIRKGETASIQSPKGSYQYRYADLADILAVVAPVLAKHGLSWTARTDLDGEGQFILHYALCHSGGHRESGTWPLPDPAKYPSQEIGKAMTYSRRYAFCAVTGIAPGGDDDDGASTQHVVAAQRPNRRQSEPKPTPPVAPPRSDRPVDRKAEVAKLTEQAEQAGQTLEEWIRRPLSQAGAATIDGIEDRHLPRLVELRAKVLHDLLEAKRATPHAYLYGADPDRCNQCHGFADDVVHASERREPEAPKSASTQPVKEG